MRDRFVQLFMVLLVLTFATQCVYGGKVEKVESLMHAAKNGKAKKIKKLLAEGVDVNSRNKDGETALMLAARHNKKKDIVQLLLDEGANLHAKDKEDLTALIHASLYGRASVVKFLVSNGADVNFRGKGNWTALNAAVYEYHADTVEALLDLGADVSNELAYVAQFSGDAVINCMKRLMYYGADVNTRDKRGNTALINAVWNENARLVKILLSKGTDVNLKNQSGFTALAYAKSKGNEKIVKLLLKAGAEDVADVKLNVEDMNSSFSTNLLHASKNGNTEMVRTFLIMLGRGVGLDLEARTDQGDTPLLLAARYGHIGTLKLLLLRGAHVEARNNKGNTALMSAAEEGHTKIVKMLLDKGADVNVESKTGLTALKLVKDNDRKDIVKLLKKAGAEVKEKKATLVSAVMKNDIEALKNLLENGAEVNAKNNSLIGKPLVLPVRLSKVLPSSI